MKAVAVNASQLVKMVKRSAQQQLKCILCNALTYCRGAWLPEMNKQIDPSNIPPGKVRVCVYPICEPCIKRGPDTKEINRRLIQEHQSYESN